MRRDKQTPTVARIRIVGVGGGGGNAINHMIAQGIYGVDFIAINTDSLTLSKSKAPTRICIGKSITRLHGAGGDQQLGEQAALESVAKIKAALQGSDMVFITAGMGGGTGTGATPVVAQVARELGAFTVAIVTRPFLFEGGKHAKLAETGIEKLKGLVNTLVVISNDRLLYLVDERTSLNDAFQMVNDALYRNVRDLSEMITIPGLINLDFADVQAVMSKPGAALIGSGCTKGPDRARIAAEQATCSPLLDMTIAGARHILVNITAGPGLCLEEIKEAAEIVKESVHPDANLILGTAIDSRLGDEFRLTVVATGLEECAPFKPVLPMRGLRPQAPHVVITAPPLAPSQPAESEPAAFSIHNFMVPAFCK